MDSHSTKKPYIPPQLFRVDLNPDQAILSACSLTAMTTQNGGGGNCRPQNQCKKAKAAGDSAARAS
jgi:hypothetical protein